MHLHETALTQQEFAKHGTMVLSQSHDSHSLIPCDFYFFPQMKDQQKGTSARMQQKLKCCKRMCMTVSNKCWQKYVATNSKITMC